MGRAVAVSSDSLAPRRASKKSRIDERSTRKYKRRKRRGELNDIHRKIVKAKDTLDAHTKVTKGTKEKSKVYPTTKLSNRILPRPSGIYRNGARGKEIRKAQKRLTAKDLDDARLESDVFKLVNADECDPKYVEQREKILGTISDDSDSDDTLKGPTLSMKDETSPILGKIDGKKKGEDTKFVTPQNILVQEEDSDSEDSELVALNKYQELCSTIVSENFVGKTRLDEIIPDPLGIVKAKLRNIYASTFSSTYLQKKIRAGINLEDPEIPALQTSSTDDCYFTWKNWRTPDSSKVLPKSSQVDSFTPFKSPNLETDIIEERPVKFLDFFTRNNQFDAPIKKKEIITSTTEIRNLSKDRTKTVLFRTNESGKFKQFSEENIQVKNQSVKHVPSILRRKKIIQTSKSNQSNVKTRSRRIKEPEEMYHVRQESQSVETPRIINEMYEDKRNRNQDQPIRSKSQDSFLPLSYESVGSNSLPRDSSYSFLQVRNIDKSETITTVPPNHQKDVVYVSRNNCALRNCSHINETYKTDSKIDSRQIPREFIQQHLYPKNCDLRTHKYSEPDVTNLCKGRLCTDEFPHRKHLKDRKICEDEHCAEHYVLRPYKDHSHCSTETLPQYSKIQKQSSHIGRHFHHENIPETSILNGVEKLQILNDEWSDSCLTRHGNRSYNSAILFTDSTQPVKYLACDESSETRRIPIYPRENCATISENNDNPKRNHRSTCVKQSQGYMFVPTCKQTGKVVYVKPRNTLHCSDFVVEDCPRSRKIIYQDDDSIKHIHHERNTECDNNYTLVNEQNVKQLITNDWEDICCGQKFNKINR